jgi:tight adherence protein B
LKTAWPDVLLLLAGALRAGLGLNEALEFILREAPPVIRSVLKKRAGPNFDLLPKERKIILLFSEPSLALSRSTLLLSHQTGAEQAKGLETCARLLREKIEFEEKVKMLTTQGRVTAWIVGLSPLGLLLCLSIVSPDLVGPLFQTPTGQMLLVFCGLSIVAGLFFVQRMARIEP